ncbi:MAG: bifunctional DNA primase/polymerase [Thermoplasmata archaeon]
MTINNVKLNFALFFAKNGFTIIPTDDSKHPLIEWEEWKEEDKIPSESQIFEWNEEFNNPNWAVITKKQIIVLDFERYEDATTFFKNFEELKQRTLIVKTAHGGIHIYVLNKGNEIGRHTKIFGHEHEVDLLNGKGYALLPYSEIDHSKCDAKKPCDHKSKTIYEIISTTTEITEINNDNDFVQKLFHRAIEIGWLTPEYANEKIKEWTQEQKQSENENEENKNLELSDKAIELILEGIFAKNEKFKEIYTTGNYEKYGYASSSEAEEYLITILISLGIDDKTIGRIIKKSKTDHIHKYKKERDQDKYIELSIKKARAFVEKSQQKKDEGSENTNAPEFPIDKEGETQKTEIEKNKNKDDEEEKYEISYYSKFSHQGKFYNEIKSSKGYKFIIFDRDGNIEGITEEVIIDDIEKPLKILPAPQITERRTDILLQEFGEADLIKFPGYPIDFGMPIDLFNEIRAFIHKYVEVKKLDEILLTIYVMQSAVFDLENKFTFPLIHIIGPYGRGKTRILTILNYLIPYSLYTDDIKAPAIKRVSQLYNPVLLVDEKSQMDSDLRAILNARYNRNATILNANKEIQKGYAGIIAYKIPGPMVMAGREVFNDPAIESKSFQINMNFELSRDDIPRNLKGEIYTNFIKEAEIIRAKLMMFRIKYFKKINELINTEPSWLKEYERIAEPRLYELMSSLTDILNVIPELESEIRDIIEDQIKQNILVAQETPEGIVAKIIIDIIKDWINGKTKEDSDQEIENIKEYEFNGKKYKGIYLKAVQNELGENYKQRAGIILSQLGFIRDRPRIKISYMDRDNNQKEKIKRISFIRIPDFKNLLSLFKRYDIEYINMMIKLSKIGITENLQSINLNEVKKSLDQLDQLDQLKDIYIYDVNSFVNFYKGLLDIYENEGYNFLLDQLVQLVQAIAKDKKINLENTEPVNKSQYKYFKSDRFYTKEFFRDLGVELTDYCSGNTWHYYAINIPETLEGDKAYKFSSLFSINAQPISKDEFKRNKEGNGNE